MKLLDMYCDNLYSFAELSLDFTKYDSGTTIILGKNLNMDSSNGAGKSSILKSIFFAFWGTDLNKVPLEGIVHDLNPKMGCLSQISFKDDKNTYKITRFKNYKNEKSKIRLHNGSIPKGSAVELVINDDVFYAPKDNAKIEKLVLGILGMSSEIFLNSILTGQKRSENFLSSPDSSKKELLSEILDLKQYDQAAKFLDKDIKEKKELIKHKELKLEEYEKFMLKTHEDLKELKVQGNNFSKDLLEKEEVLKESIETLKTHILELESNNSEKINISELKSKEIELSNQIINNEKLLKEINQIRERVNSMSLKLERFNNSIINNNANIEDVITQEKKLKDTVSKKDSLEKDSLEKNEKLKEIESKIIESNSVENEIKGLQEELNILNINLTKKDGIIKDLESKISENKSNLKKSLDENQCFTCERTFDKENPLIKDLKTKEEDLSSSLDLVKVDKSTLKESQLKISNHIEKLKKHFQEFKEVLTEKESLVISINNIENKLSIISDSEKNLNDLTTKKDLYTEDNKEKEALIIKATESLKKSKDILIQLENLELKNKNVKNSKDDLLTKIHSAEKFNLELDNKTSIIKNSKDNLKNLSAQLLDLSEGKNPYMDLIIKKTNELKSYESSFESMNNEIKELTKKYSLLRFWEQGFSKNGIKSFIIDEIITLLNLKIKEYLQVLSSGNVSLYFEPEKTVKKNKTTKNEISTKIYINGKQKNPNSTSGGEEDRLTLAVDLALSDVAETRSGTKFNIKFLDEPFKWVDNKGQMKALALFNKLSLHKQGFFLISHDEKMQSFCQNTIYVINENGVSRIVDKNTFMNLK
jgi:DNA repair exonuclease SbcCD ATPase subunit